MSTPHNTPIADLDLAIYIALTMRLPDRDEPPASHHGSRRLFPSGKVRR